MRYFLTPAQGRSESTSTGRFEVLIINWQIDFINLIILNCFTSFLFLRKSYLSQEEEYLESLSFDVSRFRTFQQVPHEHRWNTSEAMEKEILVCLISC